jgi:hypothetical protein
MKDKIKNPLLENYDNDISKMPMQLSFFEKIGLASILILSIGILILSSFSLLVDIFIELNLFAILIDLFVMTTCVAAIYFMFNIIRKKIVTDALVDTAFQHGVYARLQPMIENIAEAQVGTDIVIDRISNLDTKVENILKERKYESKIDTTEIMQESIWLGTSIKFAIKAIFMLIITMAIFMFLVNFNIGPITPYATLSIFILWWLFITNEYSLWKGTGAWSFVAFPIIVVPVMVMIMANIINYNIMVALLYLLLGIYILTYYIWAIYVTTGSIPFIKPKQYDTMDKRGDGFFALQQKGILRDVSKEMALRLKRPKEKG